MTTARRGKLVARRYTVEPGVDECRALLPHARGGGIGSLDPMGTKYYDYLWKPAGSGKYSGVSLQSFLATMNHVDDDTRYYCSSSPTAIAEYIADYLGSLVGADKATRIDAYIRRYAKTHDLSSGDWQDAVVMGSKSFDNLLHATSYQVADALFSESLMKHATEEIARHGTSSDTAQKDFADAFMGECILFTLDKPVGTFRLHRKNDVSTSFDCSEEDWNSAIGPYILFLSNWRLLLACYLAVIDFGQCAFGIYWETSESAETNTSADKGDSLETSDSAAPEKSAIDWDSVKDAGAAAPTVERSGVAAFGVCVASIVICFVAFGILQNLMWGDLASDAGTFTPGGIVVLYIGHCWRRRNLGWNKVIGSSCVLGAFGFVAQFLTAIASYSSEELQAIAEGMRYLGETQDSLWYSRADAFGLLTNFGVCIVILVILAVVFFCLLRRPKAQTA